MFQLAARQRHIGHSRGRLRGSQVHHALVSMQYVNLPLITVKLRNITATTWLVSRLVNRAYCPSRTSDKALFLSAPTKLSLLPCSASGLSDRIPSTAIAV